MVTHNKIEFVEKWGVLWKIPGINSPLQNENEISRCFELVVNIYADL